MNVLLIVLGGIVIDGAVSICEYIKQKWYEHIIRVVRIGVGLVLLYLGCM